MKKFDEKVLILNFSPGANIFLRHGSTYFLVNIPKDSCFSKQKVKFWWRYSDEIQIDEMTIINYSINVQMNEKYSGG